MKVYKIINTENNETDFINLTEDQERLLNWINNMGYIYNDIIIEESDIPQVITI